MRSRLSNVRAAGEAGGGCGVASAFSTAPLPSRQAAVQHARLRARFEALSFVRAMGQALLPAEARDPEPGEPDLAPFARAYGQRIIVAPPA